MKLPRVMLGANPFHGVSYRSAMDRKEYRKRFQSSEAIFQVIERSFDLGVRGIHSFAKETENAAVLKAKEKFGDSLKIVSVVPDIYGAVKRVTGAEDVTHATKLRLLMKSIPSVLNVGLTGNVVPLFRKTLAQELDIIRPTEPNAILLHGGLADLACGNEKRDILEVFMEEVGKLGATPGIATHNLGVSYGKIKKMGLSMPIIMAPVNSKGFMMNPSMESCIEILKQERGIFFIAKKIVAGGIIPPLEAQRYVFETVGVQSAAIGIGSVSEAEETFAASREALGDRFFEEASVGGSSSAEGFAVS
jgi:hypothetical protein